LAGIDTRVRNLSLPWRSFHSRLVYTRKGYLGFCREYLGRCLLLDSLDSHHRTFLSKRTANHFHQVMGLAMLRISKLQQKWKVKISQVMQERQAKGFAGKSRKYAMFVLPFITVLREGLEAVVFVGGVSLSEPATAFPLAVVVGMICGVLIGYFIYRYLYLNYAGAKAFLEGVHM